MLNSNNFIKIIDIKNRTHIINVNKITHFEEGDMKEVPYYNKLTLDNGEVIYVYESFSKIMEQLSSRSIARGEIK